MFRARARLLRCIVAIGLFFIASTVLCAGAPITIIIQSKDESYKALIQERLPASCVLGDVSYTSDVIFSKQEFEHLTDWVAGAQVSRDSLLQSIAILRKKNKFASIQLTVQENQGRYDLQCTFESVWTFAGLKLHGIMIGKDVYRQHYIAEPGDPFDEKQHAASIENIQASFIRDGYFNGTVQSKFTRNDATKDIVVHITLRRGTKFYIGSTTVNVQADSAMNNAELQDLQTLIQDEFAKKIRYRPYNKQTINTETQLLQKKLAQKGFVHVSIALQELTDREHKCVNLVFTVDVHQKKEFIFVGNKELSSTMLLDALLEFGQSTWLLPGTILAEELVAVYQKMGFWHVRVDAQEKSNAFIFTIHEGARACLNTVHLHNVRFVSSQKLVQECCSAIVRSKHFDVELVKDSVNTVIAWYQKNGFINVSITKKEFVRVGPDSYALDITVEEGERVYFGTVTVDSFPELNSQGPFAQFQHNTVQAPFDNAVVYEQRKWLVNYFQKKGNIYVVVKPTVHRDGNIVTVTWHVTRGDTVHFGKTIVQGSSQYPFAYIKRELQYESGQEWNKNALRQSFLSLKKLDIFDQINFSPDNPATSEPEKNIILRLNNDDPFELRARFGVELLNFMQRYSFAGITYKAGGAFLYKNPFNCGDQFKIDADFTRAYREFEVQYQRPWTFDRPIKTLIMGYANKYDQPGFLSSTLNVYEAVQSGFLVGFSRVIGHVDWGINMGFEWMKTRLPDRSSERLALVESIARAINFNPRLLDQSTPYVQVEPSMVVDFLDNKMAPTHGSFTVLSCKGMFPLKKETLNTYSVKMLLEQSFFVPIKAVVGALRLRLGHIFFRAFSSIMPIERFYLGGANSLRGYDTDFAPPLGAYFQEGKERYAPQGGKTMANINAEIRFPVYKNVGGVIFQDLGVLSSCGFADFKAEHLLASTGFGVRLATPIGPLRFDIAWKWKKHNPADRSYAWFLAFGQAF